MRVNVLGPLRVVSDGLEVPAGPPKQRALLALLAMNADRVLTTDAIVDRLWGEAAPPSAQGSLQVYVSNLRKVLEPDRDRNTAPRVLVSAADGYGLVTDALELDVRELDERVGQARRLSAADRAEASLAEYDAALSLWRGDAYADVRAEEWAAPELSRLVELHSSATEERADVLLSLGRAAEAGPALEVLVAAQPLRERAWELLALVHVHLDQQAAALECLRRIRRVLSDELGIDPGPRLQALETAVLRQEVAPRRVAADAAPPGPFFGREEEIAQLEKARREAITGSVVVVVDGEPGLGKSTLVTRFADTTAHWGRSPDHEVSPPLWPWEQVLISVTRRRPDVVVPPPVAELLQGGGDHGRGYDVEGARLRFFDAVVGLLTAAAPLEVVLEDLHAADPVSLRLLEHVAAARVPGLLLVATYRSHEAGALTSTLAQLSRSGARRLTLQGLDPESVRGLVSAISGEDPGFAAATALRERTGGNPFFVTELARSTAAVPDAVRDVVLHRVDALGEATAQVLEAAAVVGDRFETWLVAEVSGSGPEAIARALDRAFEAGVVRDSMDGPGHEFSHALVVDALLARHSRAWRAVRHERCALALTRTQAGREDRLATIARHWLAAAELGPDRARTAADFCARAARAALARHAPEEAITLWQESVAAAELAGLPGEARFELLLGLAHAHYSAGHYDDGYAAATQALATGEDDPRLVVAVADVVMADHIWPPFHAGADPTVLGTALERALEQLPSGSPEWALGQACRAVIMAVTDREDQIDAVSTAAVDAVADDSDLLLRVLHLRLIAMRGPDFVDQRAEVAHQLKAQPGLPTSIALVADLHLASHEAELGNLPATWSALPGLESRAEALRDPVLLRQVAQIHVALELFSGHYAEALARMSEIAERTSMVDPAYFQASEFGVHCLMAFEQQTLTELLPVLELVYEQTRLPGFAYTIGLAVAGQDPARARRLLLETPLPPRDYSWVSSVMSRLHLAILLDEAEALRECCRLFAGFHGGLVVNGTCTSILGAYDGHLGEAALAMGDVESAREHLQDAVETLERCGGAYWLERARQALAKCA